MATITGTLSVTEADDTLSAAGSIVPYQSFVLNSARHRHVDRQPRLRAALAIMDSRSRAVALAHTVQERQRLDKRRAAYNSAAPQAVLSTTRTVSSQQAVQNDRKTELKAVLVGYIRLFGGRGF